MQKSIKVLNIYFQIFCFILFTNFKISIEILVKKTRYDVGYSKIQNYKTEPGTAFPNTGNISTNKSMLGGRTTRTPLKSIEDSPTEEIFLNNSSTTKGLDFDLAFDEELLDSFKERINTIFPGTVWCGMGNAATNGISIGVFFNTDNCCRMHDNCPDSIPPKQIRHGLSNKGIFTRSHCNCDREFYNCLKNTNSFIARKIGMTYFNILRPQCFRKEHPIIQCILWQFKKCLLYVIDESKKPIWQWFDNKTF